MDHATMLKTTLHKHTLSLAFALLTVISIPPAEAQVLQGQVNMNENVQQKSNPSLSRNTFKQPAGDPFSTGPSAELFDAPSAAFDTQHQAMMPPPPPTFGLGVSDEGGFSGQQGVPVQANYPPMQANMAPQNMMQPPLQPMDPEMQGQMRLQWDLWHRTVAEEIFKRFDAYASKSFANSKPVSCDASYVVTANGQIKDIRLLHKSDNFMYNAMLIGVLNSMNGNPILAFPPGSRRQSVHKSGTFSRNCGVNGFKHTINDNESIKRAPMQRGY